MKLTCYHGTKAESADNISKAGYKKSNSCEWFGSGIYFFETYETICNGYIEARDWAKHVKGYNSWAVFKAVVESEKYIDIAFVHEHKMLYDRIKYKALENHKKSGQDVKDFNENIIFLEMEKHDVDFIRALVDSKKDLGYYSYIVRRPQLQICVKNEETILSNDLIKVKWVK